ncbi:hypothetical protein A1O7_01939 [Cladophialophora yegresii CBS 114405]|uniref:Fungal N-terminal domain-containing protein n=1 Tax=Cladophialophora yegresii CBS 114405 TaxID=1182544 RepID=W9WAF2_9EURO|nr:uncharacterized protein A1O7_01939 [Cladophialophora yegresii CBS 114405]EXJ61511.1 hypothetical protein A1O7_01939 [Cladophialophora yegresii CBS 114405]
MAEPGSVAPVDRVAADGFKLSLLLNAVSSDVANAGLEVQAISKGVTLFSMMLKHTSQVLQAADSVHSQEAIETAQSIADEGTRAFDEINEMLERVRTAQRADDASSSPVQQRFKRTFKKHRVTYLLAQIESLQLSLSVMLQILQLGRLMASTSRSDPEEVVAVKKEAINQERAVAQNAVIVRYWQMSNMDDLFEASQREEEEDRRTSLISLNLEEMPSPQQANGSAFDHALSNALVRLPVFSLGELDHTLHQIKHSPRDMVQVSNQAIDPLLERWTIWREVRERKHNHHSGGRYVPSVDNLTEDEDDLAFYDRLGGREDGARGYYLEGTTTDWRKPNSASARHEAFKRRKQYSGYQPSVSAASSDVEDSPGGSTSSKKRSSRRHVIDSGSESSASEHELAQPKPRRRSSGSRTVERKVQASDGSAAAAQHPTMPSIQPVASVHCIKTVLSSISSTRTPPLGITGPEYGTSQHFLTFTTGSDIQRSKRIRSFSDSRISPSYWACTAPAATTAISLLFVLSELTVYDSADYTNGLTTSTRLTGW